MEKVVRVRIYYTNGNYEIEHNVSARRLEQIKRSSVISSYEIF